MNLLSYFSLYSQDNWNVCHTRESAILSIKGSQPYEAKYIDYNHYLTCKRQLIDYLAEYDKIMRRFLYESNPSPSFSSLSQSIYEDFKRRINNLQYPDVGPFNRLAIEICDYYVDNISVNGN